MDRASSTRDELHLGSYLRVESSGELGLSRSPDQLSPIPDPRICGQNYNPDDSFYGDGDGGLPPLEEEEWVDVKEESQDLETDFNGGRPSGPAAFRRRPKPDATPISTARRETFPFRGKEEGSSTDVPPPHLRLQPSQPFVRPHDGIDYDYLGDVYRDITLWRTRLKAINVEIADAQKNSYNDIADGARIKGWLMVGRGLRHLPGMQLIEGRAKEDIRWDVLQNERTFLDTAVMTACIGFVLILLACGRKCRALGFLLHCFDFIRSNCRLRIGPRQCPGLCSLFAVLATSQRRWKACVWYSDSASTRSCCHVLHMSCSCCRTL